MAGKRSPAGLTSWNAHQRMEPVQPRRPQLANMNHQMDAIGQTRQADQHRQNNIGDRLGKTRLNRRPLPTCVQRWSHAETTSRQSNPSSRVRAHRSNENLVPDSGTLAADGQCQAYGESWR